MGGICSYVEKHVPHMTDHMVEWTWPTVSDGSQKSSWRRHSVFPSDSTRATGSVSLWTLCFTAMWTVAFSTTCWPDHTLQFNQFHLVHLIYIVPSHNEHYLKTQSNSIYRNFKRNQIKCSPIVQFIKRCLSKENNGSHGITPDQLMETSW